MSCPLRFTVSLLQNINYIYILHHNRPGYVSELMQSNCQTARRFNWKANAHTPKNTTAHARFSFALSTAASADVLTLKGPTKSNDYLPKPFPPPLLSGTLCFFGNAFDLSSFDSLHTTKTIPGFKLNLKCQVRPSNTSIPNWVAS